MTVAALLAGYPVVVEQAVAWGEMDAYQHVNNAVYFRYFENARLEYFRRLGWPEVLERTGLGPILASTSARFRKPLTYPDWIGIGARVSEVKADRCVFAYAIASRSLGAIATEGEGLIVSFDYRKGEKAFLPDVIRRRIEELEGRAIDSGEQGA